MPAQNDVRSDQQPYATQDSAPQWSKERREESTVLGGEPHSVHTDLTNTLVTVRYVRRGNTTGHPDFAVNRRRVAG